jgi:hypothetical protein
MNKHINKDVQNIKYIKKKLPSTYIRKSVNINNSYNKNKKQITNLNLQNTGYSFISP